MMNPQCLAQRVPPSASDLELLPDPQHRHWAVEHPHLHPDLAEHLLTRRWLVHPLPPLPQLLNHKQSVSLRSTLNNSWRSARRSLKPSAPSRPPAATSSTQPV